MAPTPNRDDNILDNVIEIEFNSQDDDGDKEMATEIPAAIHQQNLGRLASAGLQSHEHFVQFGKVLDLSYEQDRKTVSLVQSLGVREVASSSAQKGVPASQ